MLATRYFLKYKDQSSGTPNLPLHQWAMCYDLCFLALLHSTYVFAMCNVLCKRPKKSDGIQGILSPSDLKLLRQPFQFQRWEESPTQAQENPSTRWLGQVANQMPFGLPLKTPMHTVPDFFKPAAMTPRQQHPMSNDKLG